MKRLFILLRVILLLFFSTVLWAHIPGQIFDPNTGINSGSILNPNNEFYMTTSGRTFDCSVLDEVDQREQINLVTVLHLMTKSNSDLQTGSGFRPTEIVANLATGQYSTYFRIHDSNLNFRDGNEQLASRIRLINELGNAAYGYGILLDTDLNIGASYPNSRSGNPGFEIEVLYESGNYVGFFGFNVDGLVASNILTQLA